MNKHDSSRVDYNSPAFHAGFAAGKTGLNSEPPEEFAEGDARHSFVEGWLMGDCERDEPN